MGMCVERDDNVVMWVCNVGVGVGVNGFGNEGESGVSHATFYFLLYHFPVKEFGLSFLRPVSKR